MNCQEIASEGYPKLHVMANVFKKFRVLGRVTTIRVVGIDVLSVKRPRNLKIETKKISHLIRLDTAQNEGPWDLTARVNGLR